MMVVGVGRHIRRHQAHYQQHRNRRLVVVYNYCQLLHFPPMIRIQMDWIETLVVRKALLTTSHLYFEKYGTKSS
jgi:hypothetical protein